MKYKNRRKVWWKPGEVTHSPQKVDSVTWKILCQQNIEILPGKSMLIALSFGVEMSEGATMVSLDESLKRLKCGLQNEIVLENTSDVTIIIRNNSSETVSISPGREIFIPKQVYLLLRESPHVSNLVFFN